MTAPGAKNPRKRREKPCRQLSPCWIAEDVWLRLKARVEAKGTTLTKFVERALVAELAKPDAGP